MVFRKFDHKWPNHLCFVDDVVLIENSAHEAKEILQKLNARSKEVGLKVNASKTKMMQSSNMP